MFKPHEVHDDRERVEIDHQIYLQSPELRRRRHDDHLVIIVFLVSELNDLLHQAAFKGGLSRPLSISSDMIKKLSHRQVNISS